MAMTPGVARALVPAVALGAALSAGCTGSGEVAAPLGSRADARASIAARVTVSATSPAQLRVSPAYLRQDATRRALAPVTASLGSASGEQVALEVEFSACLADPLRAGTNGAPPAADECVLMLGIALVVEGATVDSQTVGPVTLRPGAAVAAPDVPLREAASLQLLLADGTPLPAGGELGVVVGDSRALQVRLVDGAGRVRPATTVSWQVAPAGLATISPTGVLTGVLPGTGSVSAASAGASAAQRIRVLRPPAVVRVEGAAGSTGRLLVASQPAGIQCTVDNGVATGVCERPFPGDTTVTLAVTPEALAEFRGFAGDCVGTGGCVLAMTAPRTVQVASTARFPLVVSGAGSGTGTVVSTPEGIRCTITDGVAATTGCMAAVRAGTEVELVFQPVGEVALVSWSGDCMGAGRCAFAMTGPRAVAAALAPQRTVQVTASGAGSGTVLSTPAGIACAITNGTLPATGCRATFPANATVTLSASSAPGSSFEGWGGDCAGTGPCAVTLAASREVQVTFVPEQLLAVTGAGSGSGTITSVPAGIRCTITGGVAGGDGCVAGFARGASVTLTATPAQGNDFTRWDGACAGPGGCTVAMAAPARVTGTFEARQPLTVAGTGTGSGTVTSTPAGIACTITNGAAAATGCAATFPRGATVQLAATPAAGSDFRSWRGACGGTDPCTVVLGAPTAVTAEWAQRRLLTVTPVGGGNGVVTSWPVGIACRVVNGVAAATGCAAPFPEGSAVQLSVAEGEATTFGGWGGACTGAGACAVTLAQGATVSVTLSAWPRLSLTGTGSGTGTVTSSPAGLSCTLSAGVPPTGACAAPFAPGTPVTLTGVAAVGSEFTGWGGACAAAAPCTVTLNESRAVSAAFAAVAGRTITVRVQGSAQASTIAGSGTVTSIPQGIACEIARGVTSQTGCEATFPEGTQVVLTATPGDQSRFSRWEGSTCTSTNANAPTRCTLTASGTVTAVFLRNTENSIRAGGPPSSPPAPRALGRPPAPRGR
jgi:hypothetical protein